MSRERWSAELIAARDEVIDFEVKTITRIVPRVATVEPAYAMAVVFEAGAAGWMRWIGTPVMMETRKLRYAAEHGYRLGDVFWDPYSPPSREWAEPSEIHALGVAGPVGAVTVYLLDHSRFGEFAPRFNDLFLDEVFLSEAQPGELPFEHEVEVEICRRLNAVDWPALLKVPTAETPFVVFPWTGDGDLERMRRLAIPAERIGELRAASIPC